MPLWRWSQTSAANASADPSINFAEGQPPSSVNDSARALMSAVAMYRDDISGAILTSGTASAYTVASNSSYDSFAHLANQMIAFSPHTTNGATVTLNVDSLGAKPLRSAPNTELLAGTIIQGTPYVATYNNSDGVFYLQNFYGNPYNVPLGCGMICMMPTAPNSSFVFPFGQAISRTTYSTLFAAIGTTFGVGDGSTTFNILDLRGIVPAGVDNMGGSSGGHMPGLNLGSFTGGATQSIAQGNLPNVSLSGTASGSITGTAGNNQARSFTPGAGADTETLAGGTVDARTVPVTGTFSGTASVSLGGNGTALPIVQPTVGVNYVVRII